MSAIAATLFLGGYRGYVLGGPWWLALETFLPAFVVIWVRATSPRMREDQLQAVALTRLVPLSLVVILVTGFVKVGA
jgi:NADH-quinone oxidoreductase subunit H